MESLIQIFKLAESGLGIKEIGRRTNTSKNTVKKYLRLLLRESLPDRRHLYRYLISL